MKNIYFVQANRIYGTDKKSTYIPYATGCLAAYAWEDKTVAANFRLGRFIYTRESIDNAVDSLDEPFLLAFSCSVWNMEYNKAFAAKLKEKHPECKVLFGGHNVPPDDTLLKELPYVDYLIHGGGEEAFREILLSLANETDMQSISNISFRQGDKCLTTESVIPATPDYPSPYLNGYFDEILKDDIEFSAILETNRGCPNSCAFCDWGYLRSKVRMFSMKKVKAELDWIVKKGIDYIFCCDGNFGLFDRDEAIADYIIALKKKTGHPRNFRVCFTKNRCDFVRKIGVKFYESKLDKAQTLSFQSMSPEVLKNVGRKNISLEHFRQLMALYNEINISTFSELIIALPGETYDSFCNGLCTLLEYGQHKAVNIYPCELLPNSLMGSPEYVERFKIKTVRTPFLQIHCDNSICEDDITEYSSFVVSTATLTSDDWVRCVVFSNFVQAMHHLGLVRVPAILLRNELNISYKDFYFSLLDFMMNKPDSVLGNDIHKITALARGVVNGTNAWVSECEGFGKITWGFDEILFLECFRRLNSFYEEFAEFFERFNLEPELKSALLKHQKDIIKKVGDVNPVICSDYDFPGYFRRIYLNRYSPLVKKSVTMHVHDENPVFSNEDYAREVLWYGRNQNATLYTSSIYMTAEK